MDDTPSPAPGPARSWSDRLREPRVIAALGGGVALLVVVVLVALLVSHKGDQAVPDSASAGALQIEAGRTTPTGASASLRCFVNGQMVGEMPLADCAQRNGVSSQALDVGLPPPPAAPEPAPAAQPDAAVQTAAAQPPAAGMAPVPDSDTGADQPAPADERGQCLRYAGGGWRGAPRGAGSLKACTHALFDGRCVRPGDALYGRYGSLTLRAVPGRIEIAPDNRSFRPLVGVDEDCNIQD
ncbi:MAG: hypothetical protein INR64_05340 [Caulobacteraceae bacterium]|nr:hypothetical protein [Caulobacter sp.]